MEVSTNGKTEFKITVTYLWVLPLFMFFRPLTLASEYCLLPLFINVYIDFREGEIEASIMKENH